MPNSLGRKRKKDEVTQAAAVAGKPSKRRQLSLVKWNAPAQAYTTCVRIPKTKFARISLKTAMVTFHDTQMGQLL